MWRMRPYRGASAERAATRAWAAADRQGARSGTAAAMSAVLRQGSGCRVDQVEGDKLNHSQVALSLGADRAMLGLGLIASRKWNGVPSGFRAQREHVLGFRREQP